MMRVLTLRLRCPWSAAFQKTNYQGDSRKRAGISNTQPGQAKQMPAHPVTLSLRSLYRDGRLFSQCGDEGMGLAGYILTYAHKARQTGGHGLQPLIPGSRLSFIAQNTTKLQTAPAPYDRRAQGVWRKCFFPSSAPEAPRPLTPTEGFPGGHRERCA